MLLLGSWSEHAWAQVVFRPTSTWSRAFLSVCSVQWVWRPIMHRPREPFLHPGKSARLDCGGAVLGWVGEVHPLVLQAFDLPAGVMAAEVDLDEVLALVAGTPLFEDLLTYPALEQDLALMVDRALPAAARGPGRVRSRRASPARRPDIRPLRGLPAPRGQEELGPAAHFPLGGPHAERSGGQRVACGHARSAEGRHRSGVERLIGFSPKRSLLAGSGKQIGFSNPRFACRRVGSRPPALPSRHRGV